MSENNFESNFGQTNNPEKREAPKDLSPEKQNIFKKYRGLGITALAMLGITAGTTSEAIGKILDNSQPEKIIQVAEVPQVSLISIEGDMGLVVFGNTCKVRTYKIDPETRVKSGVRVDTFAPGAHKLFLGTISNGKAEYSHEVIDENNNLISNLDFPVSDITAGIETGKNFKGDSPELKKLIEEAQKNFENIPSVTVSPYSEMEKNLKEQIKTKDDEAVK